jgi:hypothetical protein
MSDLLNSASLVMIPSGYKEDTVFSAIPTDGSGDLSFTRASNGTRVNSAGLVEVCPWNLVQYSEDFANAAWTKVNATITANSTTAPNGTNTATKFESIAAGQPQLVQSFTGVNTISIYAKAGNISSFSIWIGSAVTFDLSSGTVTAGTATMENVGNGWYRCIISSTNAGAFNPFFSASASGQFIYIWGAQVNIGSTAKPYFPTTDRLNVPRLTYQNGGGGCPSLLLEKQSTNLITYSEDFSNAAWLKVGNNVSSPTVTANQITSPDGTQNADKIVFPSVSNSGDYSLVYRNPEALSGSNTTSVYLKGENGGEKVYLFYIVGTTWSNKLCTLTTEWQRFDLTFTGGAVSYWHIGVDLRTGSGQSAQSAQTIYAWGAQLEASSYATSYIGPTTSASATRVADACFKTGISSLIGQTSGTIFWDLQVDQLLSSENILNIDDGAGFGQTIYFIKGSSGQITAEVYVSGAAQCSLTYSLPSAGRYKIALVYASNDFALFVNGIIRGTDSIGSVPTCSRLQMGNTALGASDGKINQVVLFTTRLTNAELASLTTI